MLKGYNVLLGVTGGIACYKSCEIVSRLRKLNATVDVVMTSNATEFVSPLTFETLSNRLVTTDMFNRQQPWDVEHISLAKKSDLCIIAPATANVISKLASGVADDMLTTTVLALKCPIIIAPAMNTKMLENSIIESNLAKLKERGFIIIDSAVGNLACGDNGKGKMQEPEQIVANVVDVLLPIRDYLGKKVLVTVGGTQENIDNVRFITNRSSGKMGLELANSIRKRGGQVVMIAGNVSVQLPTFCQVIRVKSTDDMYNAVMENFSNCDIVIMAAAPADYKIEKISDNKLKGDKITLNLVKNVDIAQQIGAIKQDKKLVIFCAETTDLIASAKEKLVKKNADIVIANDVSQAGAGFEVDTNIATIISQKGKVVDCPLMTKSQLADIILDEIGKI